MATEAARLEADLALGHHAECVAERDSLARQHPAHERFAVLLMIALYRSGRQTEALGAYLAAYERLDAVGVEPGPELKSTQQKVLNRDAALNPPPRKGGGPAPVVAEGSRGGHVRKPLGPWFLLAVGLVATAAGSWWSSGAGLLSSGGLLSDGGTVVYHEFDLDVHPGVTYDLDVPPGQDVVGKTQVPDGSPEYRKLDLYRTVGGPDQFSGVDPDETDDREDFNPVRVMQDSDTAAACRQLVGSKGGKARLDTLKSASKICLVPLCQDLLRQFGASGSQQGA